MAELPTGILFGAAYYAEYQPYERLERDLDLMVEAGLSVIRVGESVWSTWEPREGVFDLDWLQPVLDAAHAHGLKAIVGTPTYAVPPWLRRTYPETAAHVRTGTPIPYGARQDINHRHPAFRHLAERLIRRMVPRYADHPAVIGWQVDNEPGINLLYNPDVFAGFREHLRSIHGDVEALNRRWGLTYWSHRLHDWEDLWTPDGNSTPPYDLAWRRYQAQLTHEYIAWQTELVRGLVPEHHFVTTCLALHQPAQDVAAIGEPLDVAGANIYYAPQDALALPGPDDATAAPRPSFLPWSGAAWMYLQLDIARGTRQEPFLVFETNASSIGGSADNYTPYAGQLRQAAWALVARGARMIEYWHWHTQHYGAEMYWGGVLGHSLEPGRTYEELSRVAHELRTVAGELEGLQAASDVGLLISAESRWAMEFVGPLQAPGGQAWMGDPQSYERIVGASYRGLFDAGLAVDVVAPAQLPDDPAAAVERWPVLVVPGLYVASDALLEWLAAYAAAGGHLVLGARAGYADEDAVARHVVMPGVLREAVGAHYVEYTNLAAPVGIHGDALAGAATDWADGLVADGATVLAGYEHPHLSAFAAVTTNAHGAGRVTYVGTVPDRALAASLGAWLAAESLPADPWRASPESSLTCTAAVSGRGPVLRFVHNWSWEPAELAVPEPVRDVLSGAALAAGDALALGPWDVRILRQEPDHCLTSRCLGRRRSGASASPSPSRAPPRRSSASPTAARGGSRSPRSRGPTRSPPCSTRPRRWPSRCTV
jgi:beta-galactosidase